MTRTNRPRSASSTSRVILHRDGTVTMWSCARQSWERGIPSDSDLAECDHATAARIALHTVYVNASKTCPKCGTEVTYG